MKSNLVIGAFLYFFRGMATVSFAAKFLEGYIFAKSEQIRGMVHRLANRETFKASVLEGMQTDLEEAELDIQVQSRMVCDQQVQLKIKEFKRLVSMTKNLIESSARFGARRTT